MQKINSTNKINLSYKSSCTYSCSLECCCICLIAHRVNAVALLFYALLSQ